MFREIGSECTTVSQVIETEDEAVFKAIQDGIDRYNTSHIVSEAQKVIFKLNSNVLTSYWFFKK